MIEELKGRKILTDNWKLILTWLLNNQVSYRIEIDYLQILWIYFNNKLETVAGGDETEDRSYWNKKKRQRMKNKRKKYEEHGGNI